DLFQAPLWGDLGFRIGFNPGADAARERNLSWLRAHGLFGSEQAFAWYRSWGLEGLVGGVYPYVDDAGLDLCNQATTFMTVFDDQFEGQPGTTSTDALTTVVSYLEILDGQSGARSVSPLGAVLADVWQDWTDAPLSADWHARARIHWV